MLMEPTQTGIMEILNPNHPLNKQPAAHDFDGKKKGENFVEITIANSLLKVRRLWSMLSYKLKMAEFCCLTNPP